MKTTQITNRRQAFAVTPKDLETLLGLLEYLPKKSFKTRLADGTNYDDLALADVLRLQNSGARVVKVLELNAHSSDVSVSLELRDWPNGDTVRVYASGEEKEVLWRMSQVENWLSGTTPWYSRIAVLDFSTFFLASLVVVAVLGGLAVLGFVLWRGLDTPVPDSPKTGKDILIDLGVYLGAPALFMLEAFLNVVRARVFPLAILEFGGGTSKRSSAERWRALFGVGLLIPALAALIAEWIKRYL